MKGDAAAHELVIIRRRGGDDHGAHKGGSWKIAYADFVTAMMAFFLVMWLINAANEVTKKQVASYFNPIKLTDSSTGEKGLNDVKNVKKQERRDPPNPGADEAQSEEAAERKVMDEPIKTLDGIVAQAVAVPVAPKEKLVSQAMGNDKAPLARDPFDPMSWQSLPVGSVSAAEKEAAGSAVTAGLDLASPERKNHSGSEIAETTAAHAKPNHRKELSVPASARAADRLVAAPELKVEASPGPPAAAKDENKVQLALAQSIKGEILRQMDKRPAQWPANLAVAPVKDGVLISLTDNHEFGMFAIGSAKPDAKLIELVGVIANVLRHKSGYLVIRGHTDSRPYRNKKYDNWQLSTARAHMAFYMLVRGGLDERRVRRIEGHADRNPKVANQPQASENRRVDILLVAEP